MEDRDAVTWLHRRAGFGLSPAQLDEAVARGPAAELQQLLDAGSAELTDPWDDEQLPLDPFDQDARLYAINTWMDTMVSADRPLVERVAWFWHGHFVSGLDKVRVARLMVDQVRLFRSTGLGSFAELLRSVTIDPAMMVYLDLRTSTGSAPNENYAREVLELFTLGVGTYTEADVQAGAGALTGWQYFRDEVRFAPRQHDDTPQQFLGVDGVHDLDTVVAAIMAHAAMPGFVAAAVAADLLGTTDPAVVDPLAASFTASNFDVRELVRATLQAGLDGASEPVVVGPLPWMVRALRVTGASLRTRERLRLLRAAGHLPMLPPNVAGWPGGAAWFASSSLVARSNLAAVIAGATPPDAEAMSAAQGDDLDRLATALGMDSAGFSSATADVLAGASPGAPRLALALASPEWMVA